jgi:MFS transporter, FHS family, glucose/mannose:H+ symporter
MANSRIKLSLFLNYFVFAILLNSVGTVILQVQNNYGIAKTDAAILEAFKDLSIAIVSFFVASNIARIGYKNAMLAALAAVTVGCLMMPSMPDFAMNKLLFAIVGASFALIKVSVYATIGLVTPNEKEHASFMNFIESFFMVGILTGYFIFSYFIDDKNPQSTAWLSVYYVLAAISAIAFLLLWTAPLDESAVKSERPTSVAQDFTAMFQLVALPLVMVFLASAFTFVFVEQGIMTWMPTFNKEVLKMPESLSIQAASILAGSVALGRFLAGIVMRKMDWFKVLVGCLLAAGALVLLTMPLANGVQVSENTSWLSMPTAAYMFPLIGIFLAPIYPAINSLILSHLPKQNHAAMAGLSVVFSALGGTLGSKITGTVFQYYGGETAFYASLIPIGLLIVCLIIFQRFIQKEAAIKVI